MVLQKTKAERELERELFTRVRALGGMSFKWVPVVSGLPDRIVILGGHIFLVELKTETGVCSEIQKHMHKKFLDRGVPVYVLYGRKAVREWIAAVIDNCGPRQGRTPSTPRPINEPLKSQHTWR